MGRQDAHTHQHLVMRNIDRPSADKDSLRGDTITNEQPLAEMDPVVLYCQHERLHDRKGVLPVGQSMWQGNLRQLVSIRLLLGIQVPK